MNPTGMAWGDVLLHLRDLAIAYAIALPIGWTWERKARSAGLRTYPLIATASCAFVLLGLRVVGTAPDSQSRVLQGLITGIGFLAAGAVIKEGQSVRGTANAASIWSVGAAGAAVGYRFYDIAIIIGVVNFVTLWLLSPLKDEIDADRDGGREPRDRKERATGAAQSRYKDQSNVSDPFSKEDSSD